MANRASSPVPTSVAWNTTESTPCTRQAGQCRAAGCQHLGASSATACVCVQAQQRAHREARLRQLDGQLVLADRHALHELPQRDAAAGGGHREGHVRHQRRHEERVQVERRLRAVRDVHVSRDRRREPLGRDAAAHHQVAPIQRCSHEHSCR